LRRTEAPTAVRSEITTRKPKKTAGGGTRTKSFRSRLSRTVAWISTPGQAPLRGVGRLSRMPGALPPMRIVLPENSAGGTCGCLPSSIKAQELMMEAMEYLL